VSFTYNPDRLTTHAAEYRRRGSFNTATELWKESKSFLAYGPDPLPVRENAVADIDRLIDHVTAYLDMERLEEIIGIEQKDK